VVDDDWLRELAKRRLVKLGLPLEIGLWFAFEDAIRGYTYGTYPTHAVLLRAAPLRSTQDLDYSWPDNLTGRFEEYRVRGDHKTLFAPEHTPALAATVSEVLDKADRSGGRGRSDRSPGT
jgi:hypothetical protein